MRSTSGRFGIKLPSALGGHKENKESTTDNYDGGSSSLAGHGGGPGSPSAATGHSRVASGGGGGGGGGGSGGGEGLGKMIKGKVAHTTILPNIIGNQSLRELQDLITSEKSVLQSNEKLSVDLAKACQNLSVWGNSEGTDLSDVLGHASSILMHLSRAFERYAEHEAEIRSLWKNIRTREEELEELVKRRKSLGSRAEREEKKLAKMGQENKNLMQQTELLQSLREHMRQMDTDILTDEAKLGDFKRRSMKEALGLKFGGCLELAEKATIVGELGKLLIEEIPLEETPPGYGRAPYQGHEQTARLDAEAERCINEVQFMRPDVKALPPGLPQTRGLAPLQTPSGQSGAGGTRQLEDYKRFASAYGDEPLGHGAPPDSAASVGYQTEQLRGAVAPVGDGGPYGLDGSRGVASGGVNGGGSGDQHHVMFEAPLSPQGAHRGVTTETYAAGGPPITSRLDPYEAGSPRLPDSVTAGGGGVAHVPTALQPPWRDALASTATTTAGAAAAATGASTQPLNLGRQRTADSATAASGPTTPQWHLDEDGPTRTLTIGQWTMQTAKKPILNGAEIEAVTADLNIPLPEMTFGNNHLTLTYSTGPAGISGTTLQFAFSALHGLADVASGEGWEQRVGGGVQVSMAEHWNQNRSTSATYLSDTPISAKPTKPFDWTYSTTYAGTVNSPSLTFEPSSGEKIPMELLARQDPVLDQIIFYDDVPLFEDELHDNGQSIYNVRVRVMPHSFFILARLFLRVDGVVFRLHDVRVYHEFGSDKVLREITGYEGSYEEVKQHLESPSDLAPLTDPNYVSRILPALTAPVTPHQEGKPWPGIGSRNEVMILPMPTAQAAAAAVSPPTSPSRGKIMDRARPIPRSADRGVKYDDGYENASFFAREHARYSNEVPQLPAIETLTTEEQPIASPTPARGDLSSHLADIPAPRVDGGDNFYTPSSSPRPPVGSAVTPPITSQLGAGQRTISASAFRRGKNTTLSPTADLPDSQHQSFARGQDVDEPTATHIPDVEVPLGAPLPPPTYDRSMTDSPVPHAQHNGLV